jgi:hypothetical protein
VTSEYLSASLRDQIKRDAQNRCGYCLAPQSLVYAPLEIEHIVPRSRGGASEQHNLWLACRLCNGFKAGQTSARDPVSGVIVPIFNPRAQNWWTEFSWSEDGVEIIGLTACERATIAALQLNNLVSVEIRRRWVTVGWHPPRQHNHEESGT